MYYVRKLAKTTSLQKLQCIDSADSIEADILKDELRTSKNTLSFWKCDNKHEAENTMMAILLASNKIEVTQFIIIEDTCIASQDLIMNDSSPGNTAYKGHEYLHSDMINLTYEKIGKVIELLHQASLDKNNTPKLDRGKVKETIQHVYNKNLIDFDKINPDLKTKIDELVN